jgi:preprotein translocase subunit SecD
MRASGPRRGKAGLPGLFLSLLTAVVFLVGTAAAQPLLLEVEKAEAGFDRIGGEPIVTIRLSKASAKAFADITAKNIGRPMELRVNGKTLMKPVIREAIVGGVVQISGRFTVDETSKLAAQISSGGAKIEVEVVAD